MRRNLRILQKNFSAKPVCQRRDLNMADDGLRDALGPIVERYGYASVNQALREMKSSRAGNRRKNPRPENISSKRKKRSLSAVEYVLKMDLPSDRESILVRAAEQFERRFFLPTIGDIRNFWSVYRIETQVPSSRAVGIPKIFKFMSSMDPKEVARILNAKAFSGPAKLGPIAEAIENLSGERLRDSQLSMKNLPDTR